MLAGATLLAAVVLVAWFPAGALVSERRALSATSAALAQLQAQDRALRSESKKLTSPAEIARIARQQFGLIVPGQLAYQVLEPPGTPGRTNPYAGDPGNAPPVAPSAAAELPPGTVVAGSPLRHSARAAAADAPGLLGRILRTLEFWR
jgi:hypothetical protein